MHCLSDWCLLRLASNVRPREKDEKAARWIEHLRECARCREALSDLRRSLDKLEEEIRYGGLFAS